MNDKKSARALRAANKLKRLQRENSIVNLRLEGYTCAQIGEKLAEEDGNDKPYSKQYISRVLKRYYHQVRNELQESIEKEIQLELMRLDELHQVAYKQAIEDGSLSAIDRVLKIMERRAKLLGLDAVDRPEMNDDSHSRVIMYVPDNGRGPVHNRLENMNDDD